MSTTSSRLGMKVPDGTDPFDNDLYLKGNLNIIDSKVALLSETAKTNVALKMEIVELSFTSSGSQNTLTATGTFANTYASAPVVLGATSTQTVSYVDTINELFITSTKTSYTVKLKVAYNGVAFENFGSGTIKMKFLVIGS